MTRRWTLRFAILLLLWQSPQLSAKDQQPNPEPPGVKIGEAAPDFNLVGQDGKRHSLKSLLKADQTLAVVFHRSADW